MSPANLIPGLNYTLPFWNPNRVAAALESISLYIGQVAGPSYRALKIRDGIDNIADLYVQTNGTADLQQIATVMDTTPDQVETLMAALGGEQDVKQLILWASVHWDTVSDFSPNGNILALIIIFTFITIITTGLRMYSRWRGAIGVKVLDYIFGLGVLVAIVMAGIWGSAVTMLSDQKSGAIWNVTYDQYLRTQLNSFLLTTLYHAAIGLIKCPILLFYIDITPYRYQRLILMFILFCCAAANLAGFFFNIFKYQPVDIWNHQLEAAGSEYNVRVQAYRDLVIWIIGVANIVLDCLIWIMPIPLLLTLGRNWKVRTLAVLTVLSGVLPSVFSALRAEAIAKGNISSTNGSLSEWQVNTYSLIEMHIMIWCFNIPALRSLYAAWSTKRQGVEQWDSADRTRVDTNHSSKELTERRGSSIAYSSNI